MNHFLDIDGALIPIRIIVERRNGARVALGGKHVILRIPKGIFSDSNVDKHIEWAKTWLRQLKVNKPHVLDKYLTKKQYHDGSTFEIGDHKFSLNIVKANRETGFIKLAGKEIIYIEIPISNLYDEQKLISKLLIKFAQRFFLPVIQKKVVFYNDKYFKKPINSIKLKYNKSNWGSCSTGQNLNFSVRLFFAPDQAIDYVVIHELAHLIEMNHSDRFWQIVSNIMPDYKKMEKILKENSAKFDF